MKAGAKPVKRSKGPDDSLRDVATISRIAYAAACRAFVALTIATMTFIGIATPGLTATLAEAIALHDAARDGDKEAVESAIDMLTVLNRADPENVEVIAYLGSSYALVARDETGWFARWHNGRKGLKLLDQALERAPKNFTVRMVRAWVYDAMPTFLGYTDDAIEEMLVLHRIFSSLDTPTKQMSEAMVPFYEHLIANAPERGDWEHWLERAREDAG